jgi:PAS domain S-box-containing protein
VDDLLIAIMTASMTLQFIAAIMAVRLIRISDGGAPAWILLSIGFFVQGIRRTVFLIQQLSGASRGEIVEEIIGLVVTLLMLSGVWAIRPLFLRIRESHEKLVQKQDELERANEKLTESELRFRTMAEFTVDWEFWINTDHSFRYVSPSCEEFTGYTPQDFYADPELMNRIIHPEDRELYENHTHDLLPSGKPRPIDFRLVTRDGETRWIAHVCRPVIGSGGSSLGWRASNRDITRRKEIERMLHEYTETLEREVAERKTAQEALAGKRLELETMNQTLEQRVSDAVGELRNKDQLMISQSRLAVMGEMISFIAHQWRAPLNNLALVMQSVRQEYASGQMTPEQMGKDVDKGMELINFMSQTIDDFRYFFRTDKIRRPFSVKESISRAMSLVQASLKDNNIAIAVEAESDCEIEGYPNEFAQALLNLIGNARDALLERAVAEPVIRVRLSRENGRAVLTISDNGGGIPNAIIDRIFEPYFSTKEESKGSGIGLFMAKTIIEKNMGGRLSVRNVDGGAEFRIDLRSL